MPNECPAPKALPVFDPAEPTYSLAETWTMLGVSEMELHSLLYIGRKCGGLHPTKGGIFPTYKLSHKNRRVPARAITAHMQHKLRLELDPKFAAEQRAKARALAFTPYRKPKAA